MRRWVAPALMLITDRSLRRAVRSKKRSQAVDGGVTAVQLREKDLSGCDLYALAMTARRPPGPAPCSSTTARRRGHVGADGVHLPERCLPAHAVRSLVGDGCIIGRSVHSVEAASQAEREGADYVQVGPVFATASHPGAKPCGLGLVRTVAEAVSVPVIAVVGIDATRIPDVVDAGADGVAVIRAILSAGDPAAAASRLRLALNEAYAA
jgi:thiamine-phosphate pyrophosphorylase